MVYNNKFFTGIRHPEELSFCKPLDANHLKHNHTYVSNKKNKDVNGKSITGSGIAPDTNTFVSGVSPSGSTGSLDMNAPLMCGPPIAKTPKASPISKPAITVSNTNASKNLS